MPNDNPNPSKNFFITPIGSGGSPERRHANWVLELAVRPAFIELGLEVERSDEFAEPGHINSAIFQRIMEAPICVADLSFLNPNVMYELGVRHALKKPVIQIAAEGTRLPFDTAQQNTIFFDRDDIASMRALSANLIEQIKWINANPESISNPITLALAFQKVQLEASSQSELLMTLSSRVSALEAKNSEVAFAIQGQGELATKNIDEIQRLWKIDQFLDGSTWEQSDDGVWSSHHKGFRIFIRPQSNARWSSAAIEDETGHSVSYPPWQANLERAKKALAQNILQYLDLKAG